MMTKLTSERKSSKESWELAEEMLEARLRLKAMVGTTVPSLKPVAGNPLQEQGRADNGIASQMRANLVCNSCQARTPRPSPRQDALAVRARRFGASTQQAHANMRIYRSSYELLTKRCHLQ